MKAFLFYVIALLSCCNGQNYQASLNFPFLVTNSLTNILSITLNAQSNYWVALSDGTVRKYDPTFSSYEIIPYPFTI